MQKFNEILPNLTICDLKSCFVNSYVKHHISSLDLSFIDSFFLNPPLEMKACFDFLSFSHSQSAVSADKLSHYVSTALKPFAIADGMKSKSQVIQWISSLMELKSNFDHRISFCFSDDLDLKKALKKVKCFLLLGIFSFFE